MAWFLPVLWVLAAPFAFAALVAASPRTGGFAARHLEVLVGAGVLGVVLLAAGAVLLRHDAGRFMLALGAPLAGLSFWSRASGDDRGGEPEPAPEPPPDEPDWERFLADLERWRVSRAARRPRSPALPR